MSRSIAVHRSRSYSADADRAFDTVMPMDLSRIFRRGFGPLPAIAGVEGQDGDWSRAGQTRTVLLGDGSRVTERLTAVEPKRRFSYVLTEPTGTMRFLVSHVDGRWEFSSTPSGGSTVTWSWRLHPRSTAAVPALLLLGRLWNGYARQALDDLAPVLDG